MTGNANRLTGWILTLSATLWIVMIALWPIVIGDGAAAGVDDAGAVVNRAAHLLEKQTAHRAIWVVEAIGAIGMAIAGLGLLRTTASGHRRAVVGWSAVTIGATVYVAMYGVMLGTYWPAAAAAGDDPAILASAITGAMALFFLANLTFNAGFALTFMAQAGDERRVLPKVLAWAGVIVSILACAASVAGLLAEPTVSAVQSLDVMAIFAIGHFLLIGWLGLRLAYRSPVSEPVPS